MDENAPGEKRLNFWCVQVLRNKEINTRAENRAKKKKNKRTYKHKKKHPSVNGLKKNRHGEGGSQTKRNDRLVKTYYISISKVNDAMMTRN